jgi:hypothetical protein
MHWVFHYSYFQVNPPTFLTIPTIYEARQVGLDFLFSACSEAKLRFPFATFISILWFPFTSRPEERNLLQLLAGEDSSFFRKRMEQTI